MSTRTEVYAVLNAEIEYAETLATRAHGNPANDFGKPLESFALYMDAYIAELKHQLSHTWGPTGYTEALNTLRKITALGVRAMEAHGAKPRTAATPHPELGDKV